MSYEKDLDILLDNCIAQLETKCQEMQTQEGLRVQVEIDEVLNNAFKTVGLILKQEINKLTHIEQSEYMKGMKACKDGEEHKAGRSEYYDRGYAAQYQHEQNMGAIHER